MNACIYGVWICDRSSLLGQKDPKFYVQGRLKEGDIVRRTHSDRLFSVAMTKSLNKGKVTMVSHSISNAKNLFCNVEVEWSSGKKTYKESFKWGDIDGYPLELAL